jgi:hypothetical protein
MLVLGTMIGCGGGGGQVPPNSPPFVAPSPTPAPPATPTPIPSPTPIPTPTPAPPMVTLTPLTFTILVPPGGNSASIVLVLTGVSPTNGALYSGPLGTQQLVVLTGANCTATANGYETCVVTVSVPGPATDTFSVYSYATTTPIVGTTTPLSVYAGLALPIGLTVPNTASLITSGVPVSIAFSPAVAQVGAAFSLGGTNALITSLQVRDASGAIIIGGANFATPTGGPASVSFTGCGAHLTPTPATSTATNAIALGAATISIAYDGTAAAGTTLTCSATATGGLTATYLVTVTTGSGGVGFTVTMNDRVSSPGSFRWRRRSRRPYS